METAILNVHKLAPKADWQKFRENMKGYQDACRVHQRERKTTWQVKCFCGSQQGFSIAKRTDE